MIHLDVSSISIFTNNLSLMLQLHSSDLLVPKVQNLDFQSRQDGALTHWCDYVVLPWLVTCSGWTLPSPNSRLGSSNRVTPKGIQRMDWWVTPELSARLSGCWQDRLLSLLSSVGARSRKQRPQWAVFETTWCWAFGLLLFWGAFISILSLALLVSFL